MGEEVWIRGTNDEGAPLAACFNPGRGMNMVSCRKGELEVIDQTTRPLFEQRFAGLGALIGPHFHHRNPEVIPPVKHEELFPYIALVKAKGTQEPFSHGIGRYAPWKVESSNEGEIEAILTGSDLWNGVALKELEGQDFTMRYRARFVPKGLEILLSVKSDTESVVGLHTYYALADGQGSVTCRVQDHYVEKSEVKPIPSTWNYGADHTLHYPLVADTDFGFHPFPDPTHAEIELACTNHRVRVEYTCDNGENSFQLWHPAGASFVCIEPLSAKDPRKPKLTVSRLKILISILDPL
ncbi:hypothetical protein ACFLR2_02345 [Chlamydiota bacterium]